MRFALPPFRAVLCGCGFLACGLVMKARPPFFRTIAVGLSGWLLAAGIAAAAEIKVMISAGFSEAYRDLIPEFERTNGHTIVTIRGPSMGNRLEAVPNRIARGKPVDVVIINTEAGKFTLSRAKFVA